MIQGIERINKFSIELQKFVETNFTKFDEIPRPVAELIIYYFLIDAKEDFSGIADENPAAIQTFLEKQFLKDKKQYFSFLKFLTFKTITKANFINLDGPHNKVAFLIHNEKFYKYALPLIENHKDDVLLITYEESLKVKASQEGYKAFSLKSFINPSLYRLIPSRFLGGESAIYDGYILHQLFKIFKPRKLVLFEGNSNIDKIASHEAIKLKIQRICVQHGWNPNLNVQWKNLIYDRILTWGDYFSRELRNANSELQIQFEECGTYVIQPSSIKKRDQLEVVGICWQGKNHVITPEVYNSFHQGIIRIKELNPDLIFIIREHPSHPLPENEKMDLASRGFQFSNPYQETLQDFFNGIEISIAIYSSTIIESTAAGVVPIIFNNTSLRHYTPDINKLGMGHETRTSEGVSELLKAYRNKNTLNFRRDFIAQNLHHLFHSFGQNSKKNYETAIYK